MSDQVIKTEKTIAIETACEKRLPGCQISVTQPTKKFDDLCLVIQKAKPASRDQFIVIRDEALANGFDVEEDVDLKKAEDSDIDLPEMYYYVLKPIHTPNQSK